MEDLLIGIGLTDLQARVYLWLLAHGSVAPPRLAKELKITRTNTYKVLDSLVEMGLSSKAEIDKKLTYSPEDPIALSSIVAEERNKVIALEYQAKEAMTDLRKKFRTTTASTNVHLNKGKNAVISSYEQQAALKKPIYFIKSRADTPFMGFEAMHDIRWLTTKTGVQRYGLTTDTPDAPKQPKNMDPLSNLTRTWMAAEDYTAPVEWTVAGNELNMVVFDKQPYVIKVKDAAVAEAFTQIWKLLDKSLRAAPGYKKLPRKAQRKV